VRLPVPATCIVAALALAVGATGCNSKSAKPKTTTTVTRFAPVRPINNKVLTEGEGACGLLTQAEVTATVGLQAQPGSGVQNEDGGSSCRWVVKGTGTQVVSILEVVADAKAYQDRVRSQSSGIQNLPGIGDSAFLANGAAYVEKGTKLVILSVATTQPQATRTTAVTKLAQTAVGRL
jgi:hypothetical protein